MSSPPVYRCCQPALLLEAVDGDRAVFLELAQIFQQETVARFDDIVRASAAGALSDMGFEAHSLKGTVGAVGATGLVRLLQDIEHAGLKHAQPCTPEQLAQLQQLLQLARDDMASFVATL
jgi:HPt (histidine-containing phosphotransfer) domain-containing protein